jgi:hypothetical protein
MDSIASIIISCDCCNSETVSVLYKEYGAEKTLLAYADRHELMNLVYVPRELVEDSRSMRTAVAFGTILGATLIALTVTIVLVASSP